MLSKMNGRYINLSGAPTNLIMFTSFLREKIVIWIEFKMIKIPPMTNIITSQKMICLLKSVTRCRFCATEEIMDSSWDPVSLCFMFEM